MGILYYTNYHTKYKTKSMQRKGNPPSPESNCSTYLMYVKNLILTRTRARVIFDVHPGERHFWRALASTAEKWRENKNLIFNNNEV